jgi:uroporphyrinogen III methyltransferase/synthase
VVPEVATAEGLLAALQSRIAPGQRVLYPRSAIGRPVLPDGLRRLGAEVVAIDVYRTGPEPDIDPAALDQVRRGQIDTVVFASPSSVRNLLALLGGDARGLRDIPVVCAGPVTARAAEEAGLRVAGVSPGPDPAAIVETIAAHWRERDGAALPRQEISNRQLAQRRAE